MSKKTTEKIVRNFISFNEKNLSVIFYSYSMQPAINNASFSRVLFILFELMKRISVFMFLYLNCLEVKIKLLSFHHNFVA